MPDGEEKEEVARPKVSEIYLKSSSLIIYPLRGSAFSITEGSLLTHHLRVGAALRRKHQHLSSDHLNLSHLVDLVPQQSMTTGSSEESS